MKTVILDNYDSFTFNLYQLVATIDDRPLVFRNDAITIDAIEGLRPDRIILSPGPGTPEEPRAFGVCRDAILRLGARVPILGVCLGHQGIATAFGGRLRRATPMHGKTSLVRHDGRGLFASVPSPFEAMRYHSLIVDEPSLPSCLVVAARTDDGAVMALRHATLPIHGVQFHPESIGTADGRRILENFLAPPAPDAASAASP